MTRRAPSGGDSSSSLAGETVWRYDFVAKGEPEEQGEPQLKATADGSKAYAIFHSSIAAEEDPDEIPTRYYPWKPSESSENGLATKRSAVSSPRRKRRFWTV